MTIWGSRSKGWVGLLAALALAGLAHAAPVPGQGTWETTLQARDINGDGTVDAYYDTALNITWLADANAAAGTVYDSTGFTTATDGRVTWNDAMNWAANLSVHGTSAWRLPKISDNGSPGCDYTYAGGTDCGYNVDVTTSELAHLYYVTLGNVAYSVLPIAWGLSNTGPFANFQSELYWSGNVFELHPDLGSWYFSSYDGYQAFTLPNLEGNAIAVYAGDVAAAPIPEPRAYALMLLGLVALTLAARRRSA